MKTLFLDCSMGAAGDMLTAALLVKIMQVAWGNPVLPKVTVLCPLLRA